MNPKVDFYFDKAKKWQAEIRLLRNLVLDCQLEEVLKWGCPCYTYQSRNIVLIHVFKDYCALLFFKGALLKDPEGILIQQTENVQSARQIRFTAIDEITAQASIIKAYLFEAVEAEESGAKVELKKNTELEFPEELLQKLSEDPVFKTAFDALTPGRKRAYNMHFSQPKQSKTRIARIEKCLPQIMEGKGYNER